MHRSGPNSTNRPYKMPKPRSKMTKDRSCKMPEHRSGLCKSTDTQAGTQCAGRDPARAKCSATVAPAKPRLDKLNLSGSDAAPCQAPWHGPTAPLEQTGEKR